MDECSNKKGHCFNSRYDEETVRMHNDYNQTVVKSTWICDVCCHCGKVIKRQ